MASGYRYIAYTQRYFGSQPWFDNGSRFSPPTHAADLVAFTRRLSVGPVHVVTWSYGSSVATLAAIQHPELFRSLSMREPTIDSLIADTPEGQVAIKDFGTEVTRIRVAANGGDALRATRQFWEFVLRLPERVSGTKRPRSRTFPHPTVCGTKLALKSPNNLRCPAWLCAISDSTAAIAAVRCGSGRPVFASAVCLGVRLSLRSSLWAEDGALAACRNVRWVPASTGAPRLG